MSTAFFFRARKGLLFPSEFFRFLWDLNDFVRGSLYFACSLQASTSILGLPEHRHVEAVSAGAARGHQKPLLRHEQGIAECSRAFTESVCNLDRGNSGELRMAREEPAHLISVLFGQHGARHIGNAPARLDQSWRALEQIDLLLEAERERAGTHPPLGVRVT